MEQKKERKRTVSKKLAKMTAIFTIALCSITFVVALITAIASGAAILLSFMQTNRASISVEIYYVFVWSGVLILLEEVAEKKIFREEIVKKLKKKQFSITYGIILIAVCAVLVLWRGGKLQISGMLIAWLLTVMTFNIIMSLLRKGCYCV